jgi:hypothetical protein
MPLATDLSSYIATNIDQWILPDGGTNTDGNIYELFLPDEPDLACCLYELPGTKVQRTLGKGFAFEQPRLRVVNRAPAGVMGNTATGWDKARTDARVIWDLLRVVVNQTINGVFYMIVDPSGNPQEQGLDANQRPLYSQEFSVMKYLSD